MDAVSMDLSLSCRLVLGIPLVRIFPVWLLWLLWLRFISSPAPRPWVVNSVSPPPPPPLAQFLFRTSEVLERFTKPFDYGDRLSRRVAPACCPCDVLIKYHFFIQFFSLLPLSLLARKNLSRSMNSFAILFGNNCRQLVQFCSIQ